ncbi:hypothetical protein [Arcicella rigui]|uniref:Outer membrane protein beta-barrel domain-containing protein n=1 Tax=Arcicella rigui TaxID=797020 RepID=A0ABU5Q817_9BACT|nr:hypothetical protein [Arcicella rigui]MEA5138978.1 hypothetical protein [Arcicella rigui]
MKKKILTIVCFFLYNFALLAQEAKPLLGHSINLQLGSFGYGIGLAQQLKPEGLNVRLSVDYLDVNSFITPPLKVKISGGDDVLINPKVNSLLIGAKVDFHPFKTKSFKLVGGLSYGSGDFSVGIEPSVKTGRFKLTKDVELDAEDFGIAKLIVAGENIRPYLGLGFGRAVPKGRIGFSLDLGAYYSGSPKLTVDRTGLIKSILTNQNIADIEKNVSGYSFLPNLTFSLTYKISK